MRTASEQTVTQNTQQGVRRESLRTFPFLKRSESESQVKDRQCFCRKGQSASSRQLPLHDVNFTPRSSPFLLLFSLSAIAVLIH